ncbi:hypothetical protein BA92_12745 [Sanguibacteroides justesenii]|uniref:Uncharacterized protein n=1 Tax=Sanguibacteroides justesenii TaxID=1547597 RepID=A0A0C3RBX0_9PORP|nr:hypothetical protein BA92_12745 [Sanguibacteroides justesenii]
MENLLFVTTGRTSTIRYTNPVEIDTFWAGFWSFVQAGSKFGNEFDYMNERVKYKKTGLK